MARVIYYRIGQAAAQLGISKYHLRRLAEEGLIRYSTNSTGQLLIPDSEIRRLEEQGVPPVPATAEPDDAAEEYDDETETAPKRSGKDDLLAAPSRTVISSAEKVVASRHKLEKMRIEEDMEHIKDSRRERRDQKAALKAAQEAEQRRIAESQRDSQARAEAERQRQEWIDRWIQFAIRVLPYGVPEKYELEVRDQVERVLQDLQPFQSHSLISSLVRAASDKALEPHQRQQETQKAVEEAVSTLDFSAKGFSKPTEWQIKAERDARAALRALSQGATFEEKKAVAKAAAFKVNTEFLHLQTCDRLVGQVILPWGATGDETRGAKLAVQKTLKALPVGSSSVEMEEAKNRTLKPFLDAIETRKQQEEKQKQIEDRLYQSLSYIQAYLKQLEADDAVGFDSAQDLRNFSYELRDSIAPKLREEIADRDLTDAQFKRLVEELVDEELEN